MKDHQEKAVNAIAERIKEAGESCFVVEESPGRIFAEVTYDYHGLEGFACDEFHGANGVALVREAKETLSETAAYRLALKIFRLNRSLKDILDTYSEEVK